MEPSSRKRRGASEGEPDGRLPLKPRPDDEGVRTATTDGEVEEFFSILRRMRDASRWLADRQREAATVAEDRLPRWSPEFTWEDFVGHGDVKEDTLKVAAAAAAAGKGPAAAEPAKEAETSAPRLLDLNADPEPEADG